eukprot:12401638-Karenia_brevis.AAC.1
MTTPMIMMMTTHSQDDDDDGNDDHVYDDHAQSSMEIMTASIQVRVQAYTCKHAQSKSSSSPEVVCILLNCSDVSRHQARRQGPASDAAPLRGLGVASR